MGRDINQDVQPPGHSCRRPASSDQTDGYANEQQHGQAVEQVVQRIHPLRRLGPIIVAKGSLQLTPIYHPGWVGQIERQIRGQPG